jgi:hypothetical protein
MGRKLAYPRRISRLRRHPQHDESRSQIAADIARIAYTSSMHGLAKPRSAESPGLPRSASGRHAPAGQMLAKECRVAAETMQRADLRQKVLAIAASYDHMAQAADERAARAKPKP